MADFDELTIAAAEGDRSALEELLQRYLPELRAFVRLRAGALVRRRESDSDLVQSVCREVLQHAERFKHPSEGAFKRWLFTTALRKIINRRDHWLAEQRDALRDQRLPTAETADAGVLAAYARFSSPSGKAIVREELERIERAMDTLSEEHREVITLIHLVGVSRADFAAETGRSESAVRMLLHRAMANLADALSRSG